MSQWKQVYRSRNKRVMKRNTSSPSRTTSRPPSGPKSFHPTAATYRLVGVVLIVIGLGCGGLFGCLLAVWGVMVLTGV